VTQIGRKLQASLVGLSRLGIAVSSDSNSGDSTPVSSNDYSKSVTKAANYSFCINTLTASTFIPNTPTAAL
jgi:hypothetical protein